MIQPMNVPFTLRRNDNPAVILFQALNPDGSVMDMTGKTAKLQIRLRPTMLGDPLLEITSTPGASSLTMGTAGISAVFQRGLIQSLPSSEPEAEARFSYDLLVNNGGNENAWFEGIVTVKNGVTHD